MHPLRPSGPSLRFVAWGVPVHVNWSLPLFGAGIAWLPARHAAGWAVANYLVVFVCLVALLVIHELGHAAMARLCRLKVRAIVLSGYGGCCISDAPRYRSQAALVAAGGLLAQGLVLVAVLGALTFVEDSRSAVVNSVVFALVGANVVLMLVNILPYRGSDGALLLDLAKDALSARWGRRR